jgi:methionine-rich copper-binding protein CopC
LDKGVFGMNLRIRWIIVFLIMAIPLLPPSFASAHVALEASDPADREMVTVPLDRMTLSFSGDVLPLSTLTVTDADGATTSPSETAVEEGRLTAVFDEPLLVGAYTVDWKVVSADGHTLKGSFGFTLDTREAAVPDAEPAEETQPTPEPEPATDAAQVPESVSADEAKKEGEGSLAAYAPYIATGALLLLGAFLLLLRKSKHNR